MPAITSVEGKMALGEGEKIMTYRIPNVSTGDTLDTGAVGPTLFSYIKWAVWGPAGDGAGGTVGGVVGTLGAGTGGTTNKITFTKASMANGGVWVTFCGNPLT